MNPQHLKLIPTLIFLMALCSAQINAAQPPAPGASQKEAIDHMHHKLHDDQAPFKEKEAKALKELNEITIREGILIEDVDAKIDELMAAKKQIMRLRYRHLIEMRAILSRDQKIKYDKNVLGRDAVR